MIKKKPKPIDVTTWRNLKKDLKKDDMQSFLRWISATDIALQMTIPLIEGEFQGAVVNKLPNITVQQKNYFPRNKIGLNPSPILKKVHRMSESEKAELNTNLKELLQDNRYEPCDFPFITPVKIC